MLQRAITTSKRSAKLRRRITEPRKNIRTAYPRLVLILLQNKNSSNQLRRTNLKWRNTLVWSTSIVGRGNLSMPSSLSRRRIYPTDIRQIKYQIRNWYRVLEELCTAHSALAVRGGLS